VPGCAMSPGAIQKDLRKVWGAMRADVAPSARYRPPKELMGATITLSNFGTLFSALIQCRSWCRRRSPIIRAGTRPRAAVVWEWQWSSTRSCRCR